MVYPSPSLLSTEAASTDSNSRLERFSLSQILSTDHILLMEKISAPRDATGDSNDFLVVMTSDLVIHTFYLSLKGAMDSNVSPQQIKLLSSHDTKNVINRSEIPKLKRVIKSAVLDHERGLLLFVLFDNLSFFLVTIADANSSPQSC